MVEIDLREIKNLVTNIISASGVQMDAARIVAASLIEAEITGMESHGLMRLKPYVDRITAHLVNPNPEIKIVVDKDSIVVIDGDNGLGQIVGSETLEFCFERLESQTTIMATVRNSNHFGTCGYYSRKAAEKGYLAIVASNASQTMAPWGGISPLLGTNPIAMSFPAKEANEFILDMATSAIAKGRIRTLERKGEELPLGIAIDKNGNDTTDPSKALEGSVLPIGQHKGYGLSMFIDILCAGLSQANLSYEIESMFKSEKTANIGHFFLLIKIDDLIPMKVFRKRVSDWFDMIKSTDLRPGFKEIYIPGEIENKKRSLQKETIRLSERTYEEIIELANSMGIKA